MKRGLLFLGCFMFSMTVQSADVSEAQSPAQNQARLLEMERRVAMIADPVAKLFFTAGLEWEKGDVEKSIQTLALLLAKYPGQEPWAAKSELMIVERYIELGLLEAANVTARQAEYVYVDTEFEEQARTLRKRIKGLIEQSEKSKQDR